MDNLKDKTREELEHDSIHSRLNTIMIQMNSNFEVIGIQLKDILEENKKTNGRVTKLENTVDFINIVKKYKWLIALIMLGAMKAYDLIDIQKIVNLIF
jgi:predicted RNA-binding protein